MYYIPLRLISSTKIDNIFSSVSSRVIQRLRTHQSRSIKNPSIIHPRHQPRIRITREISVARTAIFIAPLRFTSTHFCHYDKKHRKGKTDNNKMGKKIKEVGIEEGWGYIPPRVRKGSSSRVFDCFVVWPSPGADRLRTCKATIGVLCE